MSGAEEQVLPRKVKTVEQVLVRQEDGGRYLIHNRAQGGMLIGSYTTAMIIDLARPGITTEEIQAALHSKFPDVTEDIIASDVAEAVLSLARAGILKEIDDS